MNIRNYIKMVIKEFVKQAFSLCASNKLFVLDDLIYKLVSIKNLLFLLKYFFHQSFHT